MRNPLVLLALIMLTACGTAFAAEDGVEGPPDDAPRKVFVCKYVDKPGEGERLQTGQNPISVSVNAIPLGNVQVGSEFADAQGRSVVIAFDEGQPEPGVSSCPPPHGPPTTTTQRPTTTTSTTVKPTTTTTMKPHATTTTTEKPHVTTTTKPPHATTTTVKATTTTAAATTTTIKPTTTTTGGGGTTTTTVGGGGTTTTTTQPGGGGTTTTTPGGGGTTTTSFPTPTPFAITATPVCPDGTLPQISITFGNRPDLNGQTGTLTFSTGGSVPLVFQSGQTVTIPYPASAGTGPVTLVYTLGAESVTRAVTFPEACTPATTTTTSTPAVTTTTTSPTSTTGPTTTIPGVTTTSTGLTTTTIPGTTTTTLPPGQPFSFGAAGTVCVAEVPTIRITFVSPAQFPTLVGQTGTLTMRDVNGNLLSTQPLVYAPGTTVDILYPGTTVNPDGSIADVPGWILQPNGLWVLDPSDQVLRQGIQLTYTVNPTATAFVTYPPESANCANPDNPPAPPGAPPAKPPTPGLPPTGPRDVSPMVALAVILGAVGAVLVLVGSRRG